MGWTNSFSRSYRGGGSALHYACECAQDYIDDASFGDWSGYFWTSREALQAK